MALKLGDLVVFLGLDKKKFDSGLDQAQRQVNQAGSSISSSLTNAFSFAVGGFIQQGLNSIAAGIQRAGVSAFDSVKNYEGLSLSLESLIARQLRAGDASIRMADALAVAGPMAQQLLGWSQKLAIQSPFEDDDINKVVQLAGAYRFSVQETKELTRSLVDAGAAGNVSGEGLESATRALGQMNLKGKVSQEELNQLTEAGFSWASTLERIGKTQEDVAAGSVSASSFIQAFIQQMAEESEGAAERTMTSWGGLVSTLQSMATTGLREFFTGLLEPLRPLLEALGNAAAADGFREALRSLGELAGELVSGPLEWLTEKVKALPEFFDNAAGFIRQFRDEMAGLTAGDILAGLPATLDQLQQNFDKTMATLDQAHQGTLDKLQEQINQAGTKLGEKLAEIDEKYVNKISDLQERIAETTESFQERLHDLAEQSAKRVEKLQEQIGKTIAAQEEKLTELKADHARRRQQLTTSLMTAESEEQYLSIQAQIRAEDEKYQEQRDKAKKTGDEQVSELRERIKEEDGEYFKQYTRLLKQRDKALEDQNEQLNRVLAEKAKEVAEVQKAYDQEVAALQDRIDRENELYAKSVADQKAAFEQAQADAIATANERAAALGSGPAHDLAEQIKAAIAAWNDFKTSAAAAWAELKAVFDIFKEQGVGAGISAFTEWVIQKLNEASTAINTWINDPANKEQFRTWGNQAAQALVDGFVQVLTGGDSAVILSANFALAFVNLWASIQMIPINLASQFLIGFMDTITNPENVEKVKNAIAGTLAQASEFWGKTLADWAAGISEWWAETMADWANSITGFDWGSVGQSVVDGIMGGLQSKWGELTTWLSEQAASLPDWINNPLDSHSPARKLIPSGENIVAGVKQGFEQGLPDLRRALSEGMQSLVPPAPAAGALAGVGGGTNIYLNQTNHLPTAPAGFDAGGLMDKIDQRTLALITQVLNQFYEE